jgi:single-stranded DNA-binding protein
MHLNKVILVGVADKIHFSAGATDSKNRLAVRLKITRENTYNGETKIFTDQVDCVLWGKRAGELSGRIFEGATVYAEGGIQTRKYEKDGETIWKTEVNCNEMRVQGGGAKSTSNKPTVGDDDIPF